MVDGNDVVAVYEAFARAKERALKGEGPTLLECKTYRWRGHWTGDPEPYRTREEVEEWKEKRDPIKLFRAYLTRHKLATGRSWTTSRLRRQEDGGRCGVRHEQPGARSGPCSGRRVL